MKINIIRQHINRLKRSLVFISKHPMVKNALIAAYFRYFVFHGYQLISKNKTGIFNFVEGVKYRASLGDSGIIGNYYTGLEDFESMTFLLHYLIDDDLFADIGANVGAYSLLASGVCRARSLAIEPVQSSFDKLMTNVRINSLEDLIDGLNFGLGSKEGLLQFSTDDNSALNHVVIPGTNEKIFSKVKVQTLDSVISIKGIPSLIKIDVEGYEMEVFKGANLCLSNPKCNALIVELNGNGLRYGISDEQIFSLLTKLGFSPYQYEPFERRFSKTDRWNVDRINTIFIRDINLAVERVMQAPKRKILSQWI